MASLWSSNKGSLHNYSLVDFPLLIMSLAKESELLKTPAVFSPKATTQAPVRVENSIILVILSLWRSLVQQITSASTNLPSA